MVDPHTRELKIEPNTLRFPLQTAPLESAAIIIDKNGEILYLNPESIKNFGFSLGEHIILDTKRSGIYRNNGSKLSEIDMIQISASFDLDYQEKKALFLILNENTSRDKPEIINVISGFLPGIIPGVIYQCENDIDRTMQVISDSCYELTGYPAESFTGKKKISYSGLINPEDFQRTWKDIKTALSENRAYEITYRIRYLDAGYRWVQDRGKGVFDEFGNISFLEGWIIDVSDQKKVELEVIENENLYRNLIEASPDAIVVVNDEGKIIFFNQQTTDILNSQSLGGTNVFDFLAPESKKYTDQIIEELNEVGYHQGTYSLQSMKGKSIPTEISIRVIRKTTNPRNQYIMVIHDISARKETQRALIASEARYRAIVENTPEMIVRFSLDGKITFANQTFCAYLAKPLNELIGQMLVEVIPQNEKKHFEYLLTSLTPNMDSKITEYSLHSKKGGEKWLRWKTKTVKNDEGIFLEYQAAGENITNQKKNEKNNLQSEQNLRTLMESIKLIAIILDPQGNLSFCNSHFLELVGWKKEEAIGKNYIENFVPSEVAFSLKKILFESSVQGKIPQRYENPILTLKGEQRLIAWNNTVLKDNHGMVTAIASIGEDITDKHYTEKTREAIYKISQSAISSANLNELFHSIHITLKELMPAENFFIALYDENKEMLSFPYYVDQFDTPPEPQKLGHGLTEYVLRTGKTMLANPEVFNLLVEENEVESIGAPSVDWLGVPLIIDNRVIGVMVVQSYSEGVRFKKRDEQMITFVSTQIAMSIERKRNEEAFKASQLRNEILIQASTDAIFLETLDGDILDTNEVGISMYGYTREELQSMKVQQLVSPEFLTGKPDYMRWELEQNAKVTNIPNIRKDGSIFPVEINSKYAEVKGEKIVITYVRDITEQIKAENAIVESETKFRTLAQTAAAGIFIQRDSSLLYVNPTWTAITGYSEEEALAINLFDIIAPDYVDFVKHQYDELSDQKVEKVRYETAIVTKSGEKKWLDITAGFIEYQDHDAIIGTAVDITFRKQREHELEIVAQISDALRTTIEQKEVCQIILQETMSLLQLEGALFTLETNHQDTAVKKQGVGCWDKTNKETLSSLEKLHSHILSRQKLYSSSQDDRNDSFLPDAVLLKNLSSIAGVPLIVRGIPIGTLIVCSKHSINENELKLLKTIEDLAASAVHRSDLFAQTSQQTIDLKRAYNATLEGWAHALELRDKETQGHSLRIANMTVNLAKRMGFDEDNLDKIRRGALLHDIGKMGVPDTILLKPGGLSEEEWNTMQKHPTYAYDMLSELPYFNDVMDIPYCHHEWWDGSGYPRGLKGEEIPMAARIFAIVDSWDALVSDRPYRKAWIKQNALAHIVDQAGTHFDVNVVDQFVQMIMDET